MIAFQCFFCRLQKLQPSDWGVTLLELLGTLSIAGILAAISVPSFISFVNRARVNRDLAELQGLVQLTQREAIKSSRTCTLTLADEDVEKPNLTATCLSTGDRILENVKLKYNNIGQDINFDFRGHTSPLRTIVLYSEATNHKRCLVVSNGIGVIRVGVYANDDLSSISASSCQTTG